MKVINPNGPDEYKYTSDYREIPREYLENTLIHVYPKDVELLSGNPLLYILSF